MRNIDNLKQFEKDVKNVNIDKHKSNKKIVFEKLEKTNKISSDIIEKLLDYNNEFYEREIVNSQTNLKQKVQNTSNFSNSKFKENDCYRLTSKNIQNISVIRRSKSNNITKDLFSSQNIKKISNLNYIDFKNLHKNVKSNSKINRETNSSYSKNKNLDNLLPLKTNVKQIKNVKVTHIIPKSPKLELNRKLIDVDDSYNNLKYGGVKNELINTSNSNKTELASSVNFYYEKHINDKVDKVNNKLIIKKISSKIFQKKTKNDERQDSFPLSKFSTDSQLNDSIFAKRSKNNSQMKLDSRCIIKKKDSSSIRMNYLNTEENSEKRDVIIPNRKVKSCRSMKDINKFALNSNTSNNNSNNFVFNLKKEENNIQLSPKNILSNDISNNSFMLNYLKKQNNEEILGKKNVECFIMNNNISNAKISNIYNITNINTILKPDDKSSSRSNKKVIFKTRNDNFKLNNDQKNSYKDKNEFLSNETTHNNEETKFGKNKCNISNSCEYNLNSLEKEKDIEKEKKKISNNITNTRKNTVESYLGKYKKHTNINMILRQQSKEIKNNNSKDSESGQNLCFLNIDDLSKNSKTIKEIITISSNLHTINADTDFKSSELCLSQKLEEDKIKNIVKSSSRKKIKKSKKKTKGSNEVKSNEVKKEDNENKEGKELKEIKDINEINSSKLFEKTIKSINIKKVKSKSGKCDKINSINKDNNMALYSLENNITDNKDIMKNKLHEKGETQILNSFQNNIVGFNNDILKEKLNSVLEKQKNFFDLLISKLSHDN